MADKVLITMDDLEEAVRLNAALEEAGFETATVSSLDDVRSVFQRAEPDAVILTGALHERPAADLIQRARDRAVSTLGLLEATEGDPATAAAQMGLTDWLTKPVGVREVVSTASRLIERRRLQERTGIIGESPPIQEVLVRIEQMAPVSSTVLIQGESGTGKELVAHAIHALSPRRSRPFIAVNCSALAETLLESELFGHEKGSFTGAAERRLGRFELADTGTLFLDEVGEMPAATQVKLLRVLENRSFFRVGGTESIRVDVRVVAATNRLLQDLVQQGEFREDLFFRLNVLSIYLPPLRERRGDIPMLVKRFIRHFSEEHNRSFRGITQEAMQLLVNAHWPGNVRQLRNLIESMVVLAPGQEIGASDIPTDIREQGTRLLPSRVGAGTPEAGGAPGAQELQFIFRSLVDLKVEIEELRRRLDEQQAPVGGVEMIDVTPRPVVGDVERAEAIDLTDEEAVEEAPVVFEAGMTMADVERVAIEAALRDAGGNRRKAAERLGIGERTLYRKIKEYGLD
jgi:DNA-binding NtrC family response regulator